MELLGNLNYVGIKDIFVDKYNGISIGINTIGYFKKNHFDLYTDIIDYFNELSNGKIDARQLEVGMMVLFITTGEKVVFVFLTDILLSKMKYSDLLLLIDSKINELKMEV